MKVLYIISGTNVYGGATKSFISMLCGIKEKGVSVVVVCPDNQGVYMLLKDKYEIPVYSIPMRPNIFPPARSFKDIVLYPMRLVFHFIIRNIAYMKVLNICKKERPNIIHTNVSIIDVGYRVSKKLKLPHIYHIREYQDKDFDLKIIPSMAQFKKILANNSYSIAITQDIFRYFDLDRKRSIVVYNGIGDSNSIGFDENKSDYYLFAGRLEEAKGVDSVIKSFNDMKIKIGSKTKLLIAGTSSRVEYIAYLKDLVKELKLEDEVLFLGARNDVDALMKKAKALIVGSRSEGFGRITAEAMFNGCLVIGRNSGGTKEQFDNGLSSCGKEIGIRFSNNDGLTSALIDVEKQGVSSYYDMIRASQEVVLKYYTIQNNVESVCMFYNKILNGLEK